MLPFLVLPLVLLVLPLVLRPPGHVRVENQRERERECVSVGAGVSVGVNVGVGVGVGVCVRVFCVVRERCCPLQTLFVAHACMRVLIHL